MKVYDFCSKDFDISTSGDMLREISAISIEAS